MERGTKEVKGFRIEWTTVNGKVHAWLIDANGKQCDVTAISKSSAIAIAMVERAIPFH